MEHWAVSVPKYTQCLVCASDGAKCEWYNCKQKWHCFCICKVYDLIGESTSVLTEVVMILADIIPDFNCNKVLSVNPFLLSI